MVNETTSHQDSADTDNERPLRFTWKKGRRYTARRLGVIAAIPVVLAVGGLMDKQSDTMLNDSYKATAENLRSRQESGELKFVQVQLRKGEDFQSATERALEEQGTFTTLEPKLAEAIDGRDDPGHPDAQEGLGEGDILTVGYTDLN